MEAYEWLTPKTAEYGLYGVVGVCALGGGLVLTCCAEQLLDLVLGLCGCVMMAQVIIGSPTPATGQRRGCAPTDLI